MRSPFFSRLPFFPCNYHHTPSPGYARSLCSGVLNLRPIVLNERSCLRGEGRGGRVDLQDVARPPSCLIGHRAGPAGGRPRSPCVLPSSARRSLPSRLSASNALFTEHCWATEGRPYRYFTSPTVVLLDLNLACYPIAVAQQDVHFELTRKATTQLVLVRCS